MNFAMRIINVVCFITTILTVSTPAAAENISLAQALNLSFQNSNGIIMPLTNSVSQDERRIDVTQTLKLPTAHLIVDRSHPGASWNTTLTVKATVLDWGRNKIEEDLARKRLKASEFALYIGSRRLVFDTIATYNELYTYNELVAQAQQLYRNLESSEHAASSVYFLQLSLILETLRSSQRRTEERLHSLVGRNDVTVIEDPTIGVPDMSVNNSNGMILTSGYIQQRLSDEIITQNIRLRRSQTKPKMEAQAEIRQNGYWSVSINFRSSIGPWIILSVNERFTTSSQQDSLQISISRTVANESWFNEQQPQAPNLLDTERLVEEALSNIRVAQIREAIATLDEARARQEYMGNPSATYAITHFSSYINLKQAKLNRERAVLHWQYLSDSFQDYYPVPQVYMEIKPPLVIDAGSSQYE